MLARAKPMTLSGGSFFVSVEKGMLFSFDVYRHRVILSSRPVINNHFGENSK
jgi:hypothetical protein